MKTLSIGKFMLVIGSKKELDDIRKLEKGTHHLRRYPRLTLKKIADVLNKPNPIVKKLTDAEIKRMEGHRNVGTWGSDASR